jgi:hypothetical protein
MAHTRAPKNQLKRVDAFALLLRQSCLDLIQSALIEDFFYRRRKADPVQCDRLESDWVCGNGGS